ncbi:MAG TPA: class I SAM-dependent rRNA methyltransferase [Bacillota bacterium]|nr:class I SAM-dependent rRNA methyltransferase [Bacillota bacterium]
MQGTIYLKRERRPRIEQGHPWIYQSEIGRLAGDVVPGGMVRVQNHAGAFIGIGYYNPLSQITVRLLSRYDDVIDARFLAGRLQDSLSLRRKVVSAESSAYRLVHGEADGMPGLTVDIYNDIAVLQVLSLGMENLLPELLSALSDVVAPRGIILRNDVKVRELEGMQQEVRFAGEACETVVDFRENGFLMRADLWQGQKTGYFLDQRENRAFIRPFVHGARVLDCFSHTGSFAVHAAGYGAREVTAVDISDNAVEMIQHNARENGFGTIISAQVANAFDLLRQESEGGESYDVVMLDPPAFTKSKATLPAARRGYKEINLRGMKLTRPGGFLVSSSCSYHLSGDDFLGILADCAADAKRQVKLVAVRGQGMDHPVLPQARETSYLKFVILQVL